MGKTFGSLVETNVKLLVSLFKNNLHYNFGI